MPENVIGGFVVKFFILKLFAQFPSENLNCFISIDNHFLFKPLSSRLMVK